MGYGNLSYNSLENPIGIETETSAILASSFLVCYNSLENPIGIETSAGSTEEADISRYNSLENPIGIETRVSQLPLSVWFQLQLIRKPDRD